MEVTAQEVERLLRFAGLRVTRSRAAVLAAVHEHRHAATEMIVDGARRTLPDLSRQAVHDSLRALVEVGLVRRFQLGSMVRFEVQTGDNHHHVVCTSCGRIADVDYGGPTPPCLSPADTHEFVISWSEIVYHGLCPDCVGRSNERARHLGSLRGHWLSAAHADAEHATDPGAGVHETSHWLSAHAEAEPFPARHRAVDGDDAAHDHTPVPAGSAPPADETSWAVAPDGVSPGAPSTQRLDTVPAPRRRDRSVLRAGCGAEDVNDAPATAPGHWHVHRSDDAGTAVDPTRDAHTTPGQDGTPGPRAEHAEPRHEAPSPERTASGRSPRH